MDIRRLSFIPLVLMIALLFSCSPEPENNIGARADLEISATVARTRSILPATPEIASYTVSLSGPETLTEDFGVDDPIIFAGILVGSYTIKVEAKTSDGTIVAEGSENVAVSTSGANSAVIYLSYLQTGTGTMSVEISWADRTSGSGPFDIALEEKKLGFEAVTSDGNAYGDIQWATEDDFANKSLTYVKDGLAPTDGTNIYFNIYTKIDGEDQVIARTFYTVVQIVPNLTSLPDINETNNFKITDESLIQFLKNVRRSSVVASINDQDPEGSIDISWEYPKLSNGSYSGTLTVTLLDSNDEIVGNVATYNYTQDTARTGSHTFTGLNPKNVYKVTFQNRNDYGYSTVLTALDNIRSKVVVTGIDITSTVDEYYTMGDSLEIVATVTPSDATIQGYTVSVSPSGAEVDGTTVRFTSSGSYTITVTADDTQKGTFTDSRTTYVKLSTPTSFRAYRTDSGITLSWDAVDGADGYVIEKSVSDVAGKTEIKIESGETTSYIDESVYAGKTHSYTIKAISNADERYNSAASEEASRSVEPATVTIVPPADIASVALPAIDFGGAYLIDGVDSTSSNYKLSAALENAIDGATAYEWLLNGKSIAYSEEFSAEVQNVAVTIKNEYLNMAYSGENENTLQLNVTVGGNTYSTSGKFYMISEIVESVTITGIPEDGRVVYGSPITLSHVFDPTEEDLGYSPDITWESLNPEIATIDQDGVVTALKDGNVTIRVTAVATGLTDEVTLKSYIPATALTLTAPRDLLIISKTGVEVQNGYDSLTFTASATAANGDSHSSPIAWTSDNTSVLKVNDGVLTAVSAGDATITASIDGIEKTQLVHVVDFDLYRADQSAPITGTTSTFAKKASSGNTYSLFIETGNTSYPASNLQWSSAWCFGGNTSDTSRGLDGSRLTISGGNTWYTGTHLRQYSFVDTTITVLIYNSTDTSSRVHIATVSCGTED